MKLNNIGSPNITYNGNTSSATAPKVGGLYTSNSKTSTSSIPNLNISSNGEYTTTAQRGLDGVKANIMPKGSIYSTSGMQMQGDDMGQVISAMRTNSTSYTSDLVDRVHQGADGKTYHDYQMTDNHGNTYNYNGETEMWQKTAADGSISTSKEFGKWKALGGEKGPQLSEDGKRMREEIIRQMNMTPEERQAELQKTLEDMAKAAGWDPNEMTYEEWEAAGGIEKAQNDAIAQGWDPTEESLEDWIARNKGTSGVQEPAGMTYDDWIESGGIDKAQEEAIAKGWDPTEESLEDWYERNKDNVGTQTEGEEKNSTHVPNRGARTDNTSALSSRSVYNIQLDHNELENNRKQLAAGASEVINLWNDIMNNDIPRAEGMWTSNDGKVYVNKVRNFDSKVTAASQALDYLSNTFAKADAQLLETQAAVTRDINNL